MLPAGRESVHSAARGHDAVGSRGRATGNVAGTQLAAAGVDYAARSPVGGRTDPARLLAGAGGASRNRRLALAALRFSLVVLVTFMIYGWTRQQHRMDLPDLVVILDESESMAVVDPEAGTGEATEPAAAGAIRRTATADAIQPGSVAAAAP